MKHTIKSLAVILFLSVLFISANAIDINSRDTFLKKGPYEGEYWPTYGWKGCRPEEVGMDSELLLRASGRDISLEKPILAILISTPVIPVIL
jgi:hypothetical protein